MLSRVSARDSGNLVSIIVTTRNEGSDLALCLSSIRRQSYAPVELVVVDNQSTDETREIAATYADLVIDFGPERSAQRNEGARRATGTFVFFVDADMELAPDVTSEAVAAAGAGAAAVVIPERSAGDGLWARAKALERSCYEGDPTIEAARFFAREVFERYGGYDERLTGPEDWELPARMADAEQLGRTKAQIVHHEGHLTLSGLAKKKFYYGRSFARYIHLHPHLAAKQLTIVRPAFIRHRQRLARQPGLATVMLFMKLIEFAAGGAGLVVGAVGGRRAS